MSGKRVGVELASVVYNSPVETPVYTFDDAAQDVARFVEGDLGAFDRLFLFITVGGGRVIRIAFALRCDPGDSIRLGTRRVSITSPSRGEAAPEAP